MIKLRTLCSGGAARFVVRECAVLAPGYELLQRGTGLNVVENAGLCRSWDSWAPRTNLPWRRGIDDAGPRGQDRRPRDFFFSECGEPWDRVSEQSSETDGAEVCFSPRRVLSGFFARQASHSSGPLASLGEFPFQPRGFHNMLATTGQGCQHSNRGPRAMCRRPQRGDPEIFIS